MRRIIESHLDVRSNMRLVKHYMPFIKVLEEYTLKDLIQNEEELRSLLRQKDI